MLGTSSWLPSLLLFAFLLVSDAVFAWLYREKTKCDGVRNDYSINMTVRQTFIALIVSFLLLIILSQKSKCHELPEVERKKHLFKDVGMIILTTLTTLTYLIAEFFACATRNIGRVYDEGRRNADKNDRLICDFIVNNKCERVSYLIMPLVLVLVFGAIGKVVYPATADDAMMQKVMTLKLSNFRIGQLFIQFILCLVAILTFGMRDEGYVNFSIEVFCTVYLCVIMSVFVLEGLYYIFTTKEKRKGGGVENFDVDIDPASGAPSIRPKRASMEARMQVGSKLSVWDGGTKGQTKVLKKDRSAKLRKSGSSGAARLDEGTLAPGML